MMSMSVTTSTVSMVSVTLCLFKGCLSVPAEFSWSGCTFLGSLGVKVISSGYASKLI